MKLDKKTKKIVILVQWSRSVGLILVIYGFFKWVWSFFRSSNGLYWIFIGILLVIISLPFSKTPEYKTYLKTYLKNKEEQRKKEEKEFEIQVQMNVMEDRLRKRRIKEEAEQRLYGKVKTKRVPLNEEEKEMIFDKFDNKCAICGKQEGLHIHHKDKNPSNNRIDNLIILCGVCHKKIHMNVR